MMKIIDYFTEQHGCDNEFHEGMLEEFLNYLNYHGVIDDETITLLKEDKFELEE